MPGRSRAKIEVARQASKESATLADPLGRRIDYLRLSLTKACQMRCAYCRPGRLGHGDARQHLTPDEIRNLVAHLVERHGLRKVRLTGGDPTARPELLEIIRAVRSVPGVAELAMTTNGLSLARQATAYARAGIDRVNISLDTLDAERFAQITGVNGLERVLAGVRAAIEAGLTPVKLNAVVMRGANLHDLPDLLRYAARLGVELRLIEMMPMGPLADAWAERYVPEAEMRERLQGLCSGWAALPQGADAARRYRVELPDGQRATLGFITPMSCNFCSACTRIRVAADGELYPCLMDKPAGSLQPALRPRLDPDRLDDLLRQGLGVKQPEHPSRGFVTMTHIGG
ncbi:MAG: GTP 3',8-cyclase MoaA [Planctomycetota bacterium]